MSELQFAVASKPRRSPGPLISTALFIKRTLYHIRNNAMGLVFEAVLSPAIMMFIFTFLFSGAIAGSLSEYIQYLLPGFILVTVVPMTVYSGSTICTDISKGVYHRFRTMPFWQPAPLFGAILADGVRYVLALVSVILVGMNLGFRPEDGARGIVLAALYVLLFTYSVSWVFAYIGNLAKQAETVSGTSMMLIYPLLFASNVLVDPATMPRWLQVIVEINPISIAVTLTRGLLHGNASAFGLATGLGVCLLMIAIFAPLTIWVYLKKQ
ncbi:ABC transporter permease [Paenibacillus rubinfantis]|uniref:ABC transporter permease n=1 Tax=Paenibacillus rubinfantis TaxID=1720296 RepID=UPI00073ED8C6|nr:ABC transporter permease [Paenibacillus rubinfantis]